MNIGVLGAGFMGGTHARAYAKIDGVQVVAVSSRNLEKATKLAEEVGAAPTTDDLAILNDSSIDAVSITLPTYLHKPMLLAALKAGKHVLLEKPFALNVADCDEMIAAWEQSGKSLMIGQTLHFWPEYVALINFVHSGKLGRPLSAVATRLSQRPAWSSWFTDGDKSGGAVLDLMVHDLDALNWLFGNPKSVYARGQKSEHGMWDHMLTTVDYGAGSAIIEASELLPAGYPFSMSLSVLCEAGRVEYHFKAGGVSVEEGAGLNSLMVYEDGNNYLLEVTPAVNGDAWSAEVAYFVDCLRKNEQPQIGNPQQARTAVALANGAHRSMDRGEVVYL